MSLGTQNVRAAEGQARNIATSRWMVMLARFGYATKGIVYLLIGGLAAAAALGLGGQTTDQRGALQTISDQPFGRFLLAIVALGLLGFGLWSLIMAIFDTEGKGKKAKGIIGRVGYAAVGLSYIVLAFGAFQLFTGQSSNSGKSTTATTQFWTAEFLKQSYGVPLVIIGGLIVLGVAAYLFGKAIQAKFRYRLNLTSLKAQTSRALVNMGRFGYGALGVVFTIVGIFLIVAAVKHNADKAQGLDTALKTLQHQPFGPVLLLIVALGLIAYGLYSFVEARYRRVGR